MKVASQLPGKTDLRVPPTAPRPLPSVEPGAPLQLDGAPQAAKLAAPGRTLGQRPAGYRVAPTDRQGIWSRLSARASASRGRAWLRFRPGRGEGAPPHHPGSPTMLHTDDAAHIRERPDSFGEHVARGGGCAGALPVFARPWFVSPPESSRRADRTSVAARCGAFDLYRRTWLLTTGFNDLVQLGHTDKLAFVISRLRDRPSLSIPLLGDPPMPAAHSEVEDAELSHGRSFSSLPPM